MKRPAPFVRPVLLTAFLGLTAHLGAQSYHAVILNVPGAYYSDGRGASGSFAVGVQETDAGHEAYLWNTQTGSGVSLSPGPDYRSIAYGASADSQVGSVASFEVPNDHASLWHGTAASWVDLNPAGFYTSQAYNVSGNSQVGGGGLNSQNGGFGHALLWHGTAASAVDLNPAGFIGSNAIDIDGNSIVGLAVTGQSLQNAALWQGATHTFVNLQPAASLGFASSVAFGSWQNTQAGYGIFSSGVSHALLWHGSSASVVDLNPGSGYTNSTAYDVWGNVEVGSALGTATGNKEHAFLWQGTAAGAVDLQALLAGLGPQFVSSKAYAISDTGLIVGSATAQDGTQYAVAWTPVPEPASAMLAGLGAVFLAGRRRPRRRGGVGIF